MPEEPEIEAHDLQEDLDELHAHHEAHEPQKASWTRFIALTTALLAAFAAVGALQSGALVNDALISQIKASDTWNEYQAARTKSHLYSVMSYSLLDSGISPAAKAPAIKGFAPEKSSQRLRQYIAQIDSETKKTEDLSKDARALEKESEGLMHKHHQFAYSVALLQVAIALGAISALTRNRHVWLFSTGIGICGIVFFVLGFVS
jgi:hypothetical protein